ncbi:hypothetical protein TruAng_008528 [Truncatella angustata]|nr:hypothetical protein TruAng_008528 [Truncatella angustata]
MRSVSFATALAALALGASGLPQARDASASPQVLEQREYVYDCDCRKPTDEAHPCSSIQKNDPDPSKGKLNFVATCGTECKVTVGGKDVEFKFYSSIGQEGAEQYGISPWACTNSMNQAACTFDWYGAMVNVYCPSG